jgi:L-fuconolactonase
MIAGVVGWVDLTSNGVADQLAALRARPGGARLVGIRHLVQDEPDPQWLCRRDVRRGLAEVAASGLSYDLLIKPPQLAAAVETVAACPELRFVLDHAAKPRISVDEREPWRTQIGQLGRLPNITVKLSGLITEAVPDSWTVADLRPFVEILLEAFGAHRTMFGSDWPVCLLAGSYDDVIGAAEQLTAELSPDERESIFGGTATRSYGLADL